MELGGGGRAIYARPAMSLSRSSRSGPDVLSDVLAALGTCRIRGTRLEASGDWSLSFRGRGRLKFVAVVRGRCWLIVPRAAPEALSEGDVFLLSDTPFTVASDPAVAPVDGMSLYEAPDRDVVRLGQGADTVMVGGGSAFDGDASSVFEALPAFLRVDRASAAAVAVGRTLELLAAEAAGDRLGASFVAERLAEILLLEAIRAFAGAGGSARVGWIGALADRRIGAALRLMHGEVAHPWTLGALASAVGMSRSAFSARFTARVGRPPLDYLTHRRMVLARQELRDAGRPVSEVARSVGYASQSAFAQAFKRTFGATPRAARKAGRGPGAE